MGRLLGNVGLRIGLVGVFVVGGFLFRDFLPGGADELRVGDCFQEPALDETVDDVQHRPCTDAHDAEVIYVAEHPAAKGAMALSDEDLRNYVGTYCLPAFQAYTGQSFDLQEVLDIGYFYPTTEGWDDGDRTIICWTVRLDGTEMSSTVKISQ